MCVMKKNDEALGRVIVDTLCKHVHYLQHTKTFVRLFGPSLEVCVQCTFSSFTVHIALTFDKQKHAKRKRLSDVLENIIHNETN